LGARILAVASDYDGLQHGLVTNRWLSTAQAQAFIVDTAANATIQTWWMRSSTPSEVTATPPAPIAGSADNARALHSGMVLTRDMVTRDGILLLSRDHVLDAALIKIIREYEENDAHPFQRPRARDEWRMTGYRVTARCSRTNLAGSTHRANAGVSPTFSAFESSADLIL